MRVYRQPAQPRRSLPHRIARAAAGLVLLVVMVACGLAGGAYLYARQTLDAIAAHTPAVKTAQKILHAVPAPSHPAIALIAGYDQRMGAENGGYAAANSDTLMLLRADPANRTLSLLSFPRDLVVPIYCTGDTVAAQNRINAAWGICGGPAGTLDTVEHLTGLPVNYLVTVDFHGFKLLVNKLHGVYMNVDQRYYNPPHDGWAAIDLEPGYQRLDGQQALNYVRYRHTDSDLYRLARQQLFIQALKSRLEHGLSLTQIPQIVDAIKGSVEVGRGGGGAPTMSEIQSYAGLLYRLPPGHLLRNAIDISQLQPYGPSGYELKAPPQAVAAAVDRFLHPHVSSPKSRARAAVRPRPAPLRPGRVSTLVLNGGDVNGRAAATTSLLAGLGYRTASLPSSVPANAPRKTFGTTVYYDPHRPIATRAAQTPAPLFGAGIRIEPFSPPIASLARQAGRPLTVVAFGSAFSGTLRTTQSARPASASRPRPDTAAVEPVSADVGQALAQATPKMPFRLYLPRQISSGSQLSANEGIRTYTPAPGHHATVLTFVTPAGNVYWQIEETDWNDAPILAGPTGHETIQGRRYDLYTTGGHLQMVVLHTRTAAYWVVNSLLDNLSNRTMLAIAKSLRPLP